MRANKLHCDIDGLVNSEQRKKRACNLVPTSTIQSDVKNNSNLCISYSSNVAKVTNNSNILLSGLNLICVYIWEI